ncbi:WecB/TagA/CpsF family glycosyltransferase [Lactobacillus sp. PV037]|uniref:WecB/TagA/CpsF family glycosyltransferase n=1 Tax=Lactobacillus sp. PV037 TaxID=2594496 RepID=UPI0022404301|nr:WecB/TagA/CpsF family glycosyltransferase [Lactobacillus sp. PV037]QNQ83195.1 WecB/TagA/CpsF family glycosyltransferase [Lactobacillus sp. PV037]
MNKVNVLGINFNNFTLEEFKKEFIHRLNNHRSTLIVTANPEIVMATKNDSEYFKIIKEDADYVTADGIGILLAAKMQKQSLKERVTGYDLFTWLLRIANLRGLKIYLVGAKAEVLEKTKQKIAQKYPNIKIVGAEDGYFKEDLKTVANRIEKAKPDLVFAALGFPRQEKLLAILRKQKLPALMMGVGGSFDVFSGVVKRAPKKFQQMHLEWFYRLITNPTRLKRMLVLPKFVVEVEKKQLAVKKGKR